MTSQRNSPGYFDSIAEDLERDYDVRPLNLDSVPLEHAEVPYSEYSDHVESRPVATQLTTGSLADQDVNDDA
eukprot:scaffold662666_cov70-Prasinocladus_malaysianus.AAC.1